MATMQGGWCRHVPRLFLIVLSGVLLAANLKSILPGWMQTMVEAMVVLLSLVDVYVLQANLERRSFTVTLMCMEIVEATLSFVMLFPHTCGLSRVAVSTYLVVNNAIDVVAGFYYEIRAHKLALCLVDDEARHPVYKVLTGRGFKFGFILFSLYKVAFIATVDFVNMSFAMQNVMATLFFCLGLVQVMVASLAGGSLCCCVCFRYMRPTNGTIRGYFPILVLGVIIEIFMSSPLSLGLDEPACEFQAVLAAWSLCLCIPIIQLLETRMIFRCFALSYRRVDPRRPEPRTAVSVSAEGEADVEVAIVEMDAAPKNGKTPITATAVLIPKDDADAN